MSTLKEDASGSSVSASNIAGNRGYSIFGQKSKPMKRVIDTDNIPVISYKHDSRKLKSYTKKGPMASFGFFLSNNLGFGSGSTSTNENFNLSDALSKINNVAKQSQATKTNSVQFGLQDDKDNIIRVFVDAEHAEEFESALQHHLEVDMKKIEIAELLFLLKDEFNILNVVWPTVVDDAVEEEETSKNGEMQNQDTDMNDETDLDSINPDDQQSSDENRGVGEEKGTHDVGEDDIPVADLPQQDAFSGADDQKTTINSILAMLSSDAEAKKADADARAAEARAREAESMARAAEAKIKSEEQILDMEAYNKTQTTEKTETRKLAKLAKYRHDLKRERSDGTLDSDTIEIDSDQSKRFEEEENHVSKLDGYKSNKNISIDTLMKIARAMQAQENAQE